MENKKLTSSWGVAFTVASVWFGTHVGGGFASGNQVVGYFSKYGPITAMLFPLLAMGILAYVMHITLKFARLNGFTNYKDTYEALYPHPKMEILFEIFYIIIILAAVAAAVAGAGEVVANFMGLQYVGTVRLLCNLAVVALLILLSIFGVKLVAAASTVLSIGIMITTALIVVLGVIAANDGTLVALLEQYKVQVAPYDNNIGMAIWRGIIIYAAFQCVSIPAMIAASGEMTTKGTSRACFLGWLMNGIALGASGYMLAKWYPLLAALKAAGVEGFKNALGIPNQTVIKLAGLDMLGFAFSVLLFCAFVSTCVTLIFTMVQRFQGKLSPSAIKSEKLRSIIVAAIVIAICFSISLLGLTTITTKLYGYDGYYAILVILLPTFIWGIPKVRKLEAELKKTE